MRFVFRAISLSLLCISVTGCTGFPFILPAYGQSGEVGSPSFVAYSQSQRRLDLGAKFRNLTPYVASAVAPVTAEVAGSIDNGEPDPTTSLARTDQVASIGSVPVPEPVELLPPPPVPPCSDGTQRQMWVLNPESDLADGLRLWTAQAGLSAFYTDTDGWRFPLGKAGIQLNGCFDEAVTAALGLFARHPVRPKVQVDRDGYVYLSVFVGAPQ